MLHIILPLLIIIFVFFFYARKKEKFQYTNYIPEKETIVVRRKVEPDSTKSVISQINPKVFNTNDIKYDSYKSSNLCNDKVLYPINSLDVNYDNKMSSNCKCQQFIQSP
jgi:hypothetical protein